MKLNQKVRYAVACLFELAKVPGEYIDTETMSQRQNVPSAYAHKVLQALCHANLVYSLKGVGYQLARPLNSITALDVMEALNKEVDPTASNPDMGFALEQKINEALGNVTLGELAGIH